MTVKTQKSSRLSLLQEESVAVNIQIREAVDRQSKASSGILSSEINKLVARQRNIRININQEKQKENKVKV